jgi:hypothetical protein
MTCPDGVGDASTTGAKTSPIMAVKRRNGITIRFRAFDPLPEAVLAVF